MVNPHRGEVTVKLARLDTEDYDLEELVLRPTFEAITEIETKAGVGVLEFMRRFMRPYSFGLRDVMILIAAGLHGAGKIAEPNNIGARIVATGLDTLVEPCVQFLNHVWFGGQDPLKPSMRAMESQSSTADTPPGNGSASPAAP